MSASSRGHDDHARDTDRDRLELPGVQPGTVHGVNGSDVTVTVDVWGARQYFGPIPWCAAQGDGPAKGDDCFLHSDAYGQPLYAVVVGSGDHV